MSDIRFPSSLKPIVNRGYSQTRGSNIWRNTVQGGVPRQGRDTYFEPVPIEVILGVSSLGRQAFLSFLNNIHGGADSFIMALDSGMGIQDHQVSITSDISDSTNDGLNWTIGFTATAERTAIQEDTCLTANLPDLYGCYGDGLNKFLAAYNTYATTFPRIWEPNVIALLDAARQYMQGFSFSRTGDASYFDGSFIRTVGSDTPRYQPDGLLIEPGRTNLLTQSATFETWSVFNVSKSASGPALIYGAASTLLTATAAALPRLTQNTAQNTIVDSGWALSFIFKAGSTSNIHGRIAHVVGDPVAGGIVQFFYNTITGQFSQTTSGTQITFLSYLVTTYGDFVRLSVRVQTTGLTRVTCFIGPSSAFGSSDATIGDSIIVAHAQLERFAASTSPIITTTTAGSRSADVLNVTTTGGVRLHREYTPIGSVTPVDDTISYTGALPTGSIRVLELLND